MTHDDPIDPAIPEPPEDEQGTDHTTGAPDKDQVDPAIPHPPDNPA